MGIEKMAQLIRAGPRMNEITRSDEKRKQEIGGQRTVRTEYNELILDICTRQICMSGQRGVHAEKRASIAKRTL